MKSKIKFIIIIGIVLILLIGAAVALKVTAPEEEEEAPAEEVKTSLLFDKNPADIETLTIKNDTSEYKVERIGKDGNYMWTVFEYLEVPIDGNFINTLIQNAATMTAQQTVDENAPDLSIYGLDTPAAEYKVEFADSDSTVKNICIGDPVPGSSSKNYMCFKGETAVYTVNSSDVSCFTQDKSMCVNKVLYTARTASSETDTTDYTRITKLVIDRKDIDYDIVIEYDTRQDDKDAVIANSSRHRLTSPVTLDLNPEKSSAVTSNVFGLTANSFAVLTPDDAQKAEYGFDDPYAVFTFDIAGETFTLTVGNSYTDEALGKCRYVMASGIDVIYCFAEANLPWLTVMPLDITTPMITSNYIYGVTSVEFSGKEAAYFELSGGSDNFAVKMDGAEVDAESFKKFYQFILRTPAEQLCFDEPEGEPSLTVAIKSATGDDTLEFFPAADRRTIIRVNGVTSFTCKTAYVDRLAENLVHFKNGENIIENW